MIRVRRRARAFAGRARVGPVDPLPRQQGLRLRGAGRHPHHVVAHAEPRPQGVQLHQVPPVPGDEERGHDRPPATAAWLMARAAAMARESVVTVLRLLTCGFSIRLSSDPQCDNARSRWKHGRAQRHET